MRIDATQQAILASVVDGGSVREPALTIHQSRNPQIKLIAGGEQVFRASKARSLPCPEIVRAVRLGLGADTVTDGAAI